MPEINAENLREMHTQLTAAGVTECAGIAFDTIRLEARVDVASNTIINLGRDRDSLRAALTEAGTVSRRLASDLAQSQAENAALRARLAERPAPPDPRDPPVKTAAEEEAAERLWGALFTLGGGINRVDFEGGIEGITDAVEEALGYNLAQLRKVTTERDRIESIALEQFRRRLSGA